MKDKERVVVYTRDGWEAMLAGNKVGTYRTGRENNGPWMILTAETKTTVFVLDFTKTHWLTGAAYYG